MVRTRPEGFVAGLARWVGRRRVVLEQATGSQRLLTSHEVGRAPSELAAWRPHGADGSPRELVAAPFGLVGDLEDRGAFALTDDGYTLPGRRFGLGAESRAVTPAGSLIVQERQGGNRLFAWRAPTELADLAPIADSSLVRFGNRIAWIDDETLWSTDGEAVDSLLPVGRLQVVGTAAGKLFLGDATGLTATDGTPAGTEGIGRGAFFDARVISDRGDRALLTTRYAGLWVSDGTAAATGPLVWRFDLHAMSSQPGVDLIFGTRRDRGGSALFTWDGTKLRGIRRLGGRVLETLPMGGRTIFSMRTDGRGDELWTSDGTAAGTRLLVDLWPGPFGSSPADLTAVAGGLVFVASTPSEGRELWFSDGTAAGTRLLADVYPGNASSRPTELVAIGDEIYFAAADESAGRELRSVSLHGRGCRERRETD